MNETIFIISFLVSFCVASRDSIFIPIHKIHPNGEIKLHINGKLSDEDLTDIINNPDPRVCDEIYVNSVPTEDLRKIFKVYGKDATKLNFENSFDETYEADDLVDVLNLLPNIETLKFSWHKKEFWGKPSSTLNLTKLSEIKLIDNTGKNKKIILNFLTKVLPENSLKALELEDDESYGEFLSKQRNLKILKFVGFNPTFRESFKDLKLEELSCIIASALRNKPEKLPKLRSFTKALIESQPNLKVLKLVDDESHFKMYSDNIVDDEIFSEILKLSNLEVLELSTAAISNLNGLQNLTNLREILIKAESVQSIEQLSNFKSEILESLTLEVDKFDITDEIYSKLSQNLPNLKSLRVTFEEAHTINFFAENFPQIEELKVRFVSSEVDPFIKGNEVHQKMKKIHFHFDYVESSLQVGTNNFFGMLYSFPKLENFEITSNFGASLDLPFTTDFVSKLAASVFKLPHLKVLKIGSFAVSSYENFPVKKAKLLKYLASKLKYFSFSLYNEQQMVDPHYRKPFKADFSFRPLVDQVKDVFSFKESVATVGEIKTLTLEAGVENYLIESEEFGVVSF